MKKIVVFVLVLLMVGLTYFAKNKEIPLFNLNSITKVCFVVDENEEVSGETVECGTKKFVYMNLEEARKEVENIKFIWKKHARKWKTLNLTPFNSILPRKI